MQPTAKNLEGTYNKVDRMTLLLESKKRKTGSNK